MTSSVFIYLHALHFLSIDKFFIIFAVSNHPPPKVYYKGIMKEGKEEESNLNLLFETSWEVCNKIGGIYTVLSTKAKTLHKLYKDKVVFVGPDVWSDDNPSPFL